MTDPAVSDRTVPATEMQHLLRRSFAMRAAFYAETFDVLKAEFGREKAMQLCMDRPIWQVSKTRFYAGSSKAKPCFRPK